MLILIDVDIVVMVLDLVKAHNFFTKGWVIFYAKNSFSLYVGNTKKDILFLGEGPADGLKDNTITVKDKYSVNAFKFRKKTCLSLHCNATNNFCMLMVYKSNDSKQKTLK